MGGRSGLEPGPSCERTSLPCPWQPPTPPRPGTLWQDWGGQASHHGRWDVRRVARVGLGPLALPLQSRGDLGNL